MLGQFKIWSVSKKSWQNQKTCLPFYRTEPISKWTTHAWTSKCLISRSNFNTKFEASRVQYRILIPAALRQKSLMKSLKPGSMLHLNLKQLKNNRINCLEIPSTESKRLKANYLKHGLLMMKCLFPGLRGNIYEFIYIYRRLRVIAVERRNILQNLYVI